MTPTTRSSLTITGTSRKSLHRAIAACLLGVGIPAAAQPAAAPEAVTETIPGTTVKLTLVLIPAGRVTMADPADSSKTKTLEVGPIYICTTETTFDAYDIFVYGLDAEKRPLGTEAVTRPSKPYVPPDRGFGHAGYPAIGMSFRGAAEFCEWLSKKTGNRYRLANEAEWEHAARAGASGSFGVATDTLGDHAWFGANSEAKTHPVGSKHPNTWGLFDMHGNVAEWVVGLDGKPVTKGGSYLDSATDLDVSDRVKPSPAWNASDPQMPKSKWWLADCSFVGFRIVREIAGQVEPPAAPVPESTSKPEQPRTSTPKDRTDDHPAPSVPK